MSERYPGGFMTQSPPTPSASNTTGVWTLDQQQQLKQAGQWPANGPFYIEDIFQTWLYTGNGATQTITNGIDLAGRGGLTIGKIRNLGGGPFQWYDTARGATKVLESSSTAAQTTVADGVTAFNSNGITIGANSNINFNTYNFVNWTFREQPKFFDIVTYTGDGTDNRAIPHNLGSVPGCIIVKSIAPGYAWTVKHRSLAANEYLTLNDTAAIATGLNPWSLNPTDSVFYVNGVASSLANGNGTTYVAYLFAHNAGGFGLTGSDNVISCGSFIGAGPTTPVTINLGYEPQWILAKQASSTGGSWVIVDNMRGFTATTNGNVVLYPNTTDTDDPNNYIPGQPTATGLNGLWSSGETYIYIAIRRGPMKVPTTGTSVFAVDKDRQSSSASTPNYVSNFPVDLGLIKYYTAAVDWDIGSRLTGARYMNTNTTAAEASSTDWAFDYQNGFGKAGAASTDFTGWMWRRAPGYFDVVCYTGTGVARTVAHNLGVVPELMIIKNRSTTDTWAVYAAPLGATKYLAINQTDAEQTSSALWSDTAPTTTLFTVDVAFRVNRSGSAFVAYLFATCPGVSKVGSYTGTGTTQTINCGFTGGSRFVMIKRTDSTGDWYVWDSARGIVAGNDPYLLLNSTAAEIIGTDYIDTAATGFEITSTAPAAINANGGTFIFLAIA